MQFRQIKWRRQDFVRLPNIPAVDRELARWILIKSALLFSFFFHFRSRDLAVDLLNFSWRSLLEFVMSSSGQLARLTSIYMIEWLCKRKFRQLYLLDGSISIHFASNRMVLYGRLNWFYLLNKNKWVYVLTINAFNWDEINDRANKTSDNITRVVVCMDFCLVCNYARVQKYQNIVTQT